MNAIYLVTAAAPYGDSVDYGHFDTELAARECVQVLYSEAVISSLIGTGGFVVTRMMMDAIGRPTFETFEIESHDEQTELAEEGPDGATNTTTYLVHRIDISQSVGQWIDHRPHWMGLVGREA